MTILKKYWKKKKKDMAIAWKKAKKSKTCYWFLAPYAIIFAIFYIVPVVTSIVLSFTYYNVLEPAKFVGLQNYINLILADDVFLKRSILSELAKLLKISVTDGYKGMGFQQITQ